MEKLKRFVYLQCVLQLLLLSTEVFAQTRNASGKVIDEFGEALPSVVISINDASPVGITDIDGNFNIPIPTSDCVLHFSFVGMKQTDLTLTAKSALKDLVVKMLSNNYLDELVVTGYQTLSKERATGSFGIIGSKVLEKKINTNLSSMIEGSVAGLVLDKDGKFSIRGTATLQAEVNPLVVVDGYPTEITLSELNPNNIENITVLKDGVASSIYGSRAANGVIVVTTKSGKEGKTRVGYSGFFKVQPRPDLDYLHYTSASDYVDAELSLFDEDPSSYTTVTKSNSTSVVGQLLAAKADGIISESEFDSRISALRNADGIKQMEKYMFRSELTQSHNLTLSGGSTNNTYNLAANYTNTRGNYVNTSNNRLNIDLKNTWKPWKFVAISTSVNVRYDNSTQPYTSYSTLLNLNTYYNYWAWMPYNNIVDENGDLVYYDPTSYGLNNVYSKYAGTKDMAYNPLEDAYQETTKNSTFATRLSGTIKFNIFDGFTAQFGGSWNRANLKTTTLSMAESFFNRMYFNNSTKISSPTSHYFPDGDMIDETRSLKSDWTIRTQFNYDKIFGKHRVSTLAGNEVRRVTTDATTVETRIGYNGQAGSFETINMKDLRSTKYHSDMIQAPMYATYMRLKAGSYSLVDNRFASWYLNGSYEFDERYLVSGSVRIDQTNFFGTNPKYRNKPLWSVGGTWKISNESWFDVEEIDRLNFRASYGVNGNISLSAGPYLILSAGSYNTTTGGVSSNISSYPNNSLRWEKTKTFNVGFDVEMFKNRLGFSVDYYYKKSTDLLASDALDPTTGATSLVKNVGRIDNHGVEFSVHGTPVKTEDFRWNVNYSFSLNKNEVKEYNVARKYATSYTSGAQHVEGYPMYGIFGFRFAGLDEKGQAQIYGADGNKKLARNVAVEDVEYFGSMIPATDMSLTNSFSYKNWDLSFMMIAKLGAKYRKDTFSGSNYSNRHFAERWQKPGDEANTIYPVFESWNDDLFYYPYCDIFVGNANYMKLRDLTLTYHLPSSLVQRAGFQNAKIYLQGRNLFYITAKGVDIDPEAYETSIASGIGAYTSAGYSRLPIPTELYIGLSFNF